MGEETRLCESCGERPVWSVAVEHGYNLCADCSIDDRCCGRAGQRDCPHNGRVYGQREWDDAGLCEDCLADQEREDHWDRVEAALADLGFDHTGSSEKSEARYFELDGCRRRVRLATHCAVYQESGECVCVDLGHTQPDADVRIAEGCSDAEFAAAIQAIVAMVEATREDEEDDDDA